MNPVQRALGSIAQFGVSMKAKQTAEEHEQKAEARHQEQMQMKREWLEKYGHQVEAQGVNAAAAMKSAENEAYRLKTERKLANLQLRIQREKEAAGYAVEVAGENSNNAKTATKKTKQARTPYPVYDESVNDPTSQEGDI